MSLGHPAHPRDLYSKGSNEVGMSLDSESSSHLLYEPSSQGSFLPTELYLAEIYTQPNSSCPLGNKIIKDDLAEHRQAPVHGSY